VSERGREGVRERGREGGRERGREGEREAETSQESLVCVCVFVCVRESDRERESYREMERKRERLLGTPPIFIVTLGPGLSPCDRIPMRKGLGETET
jgi:hypothetical protein